jgi:hypothetical protein
VKSGTFFEFSNVPLNKWLQAIYLCGSDGIRVSYLGEVLGVSFKTAHFMMDRIRYTASGRAPSHSGNASLVPGQDCDQLPVAGNCCDKRLPIAGLDRSSDDTRGEVRQTKPLCCEAQFKRFLSAAAERATDDLPLKFQSTFSKIARSPLKLRVLRETTHPDHGSAKSSGQLQGDGAEQG